MSQLEAQLVLMENRGGGSLRQLLALHPQSGTRVRKAGSPLLPPRAAWVPSSWNGAHNQGRSFISINLIWQHQSAAVVFIFAPSSFREFLKKKSKEWSKNEQENFLQRFPADRLNFLKKIIFIPSFLGTRYISKCLLWTWVHAFVFQQIPWIDLVVDACWWAGHS